MPQVADLRMRSRAPSRLSKCTSRTSLVLYTGFPQGHGATHVFGGARLKPPGVVLRCTGGEGGEVAGPFGGTIGGRYAICGEIASGGMATVHLARQIGAAGFARMVAVKRLHERFARDPD